MSDPTYYDLGDHSESIQIDYDPEQISYEELLDVFWANHTPTIPSGSTQYASIAFYQDEEQEQAIRASIAQMEADGKTIYTRVEPLGSFYLAEDYHQKYYLRLSGLLLAELQAIYPDAADLMNSTLAARANGFLAGHGDPDLLEQELDSYGLSEEGQETLLKSVGRRLG